MSEQRSALGGGPEFDRIRRLLAGTERAGTGSGVVVGPGDDAAVLDDGTVISIDMAVEGVHFRRTWLSLEEIGYRSAAAALSDLAAMAAEPIGLLAAFALPAADSDAGETLMRGVAAAAGEAGAAVLGGDLTRSCEGMVLDFSVVGRTRTPIRRSGARPGDTLWVTGRLGGAAAAVKAWSTGREPGSAARRAFARPQPRIREARWLAERGALHALIDLSDGLAGDAAHLAAASTARVVIDADRVPVADAAFDIAGDAAAAFELAIAGGDDYELLFAAAAGSIEPLAGDFTHTFAVELARIGAIEAGSDVALRSADGSMAPLARHGYQHFEAS